MNKFSIFKLVLMFILIYQNSLEAQDFSQAFRTGNFRVISSSFNNNIELNILGNEGFYSKMQAEQILKDFMSKNTPVNYAQKHQGVAKDGSQYQIGILETQNGVFRTYIYLQKLGENQVIKELRIEKNL